MKKKVFSLVLMLSLVATTVLAGCGSGNNKPSNSGSPAATDAPKATATPAPTAEPEKVVPFTVSLRHIQIGESTKFRKAMLDDVLAKTQAEIPGLTFELDGVEDQVNRFTKLPAEMAAGNPPIIFDLFGGTADALKYGAAGRLLDLTPILEELGLADKFVNMDQFMVDGKVYGLPIGGNTEGFYYNEVLFEKYNIKEPTTWEELELAAETLKSNGITPFGMGSKGAWVPLMIINTLIGRYAGPEAISGFLDGTTKWNSPEVLAAFTKYEEWVKKGYFTKGELGFEYAEMMNEFLTGKAGMIFDGSWRSSIFSDPEQAKDMTNKFGFFSMPGVPGGKGDQTFVNGNYSNGYGFSAKANENELKAIKAFIKNLYNEEMQVRGLNEDGLLPSMKISGDATAKVDDKIVTKVISILATSGGGFSHFDSKVTSEVNAETESQIQKLIAGKATAQQAVDAIQKVADESRK